MSHFIFGCFKSDVVVPQIADELKKMAQKKEVFIWFDNEIDFYSEISKMAKEQGGKGKVLFALTSRNQPCNSDELLFPYDKYTNEQLFADKTREYFSQCCQENLEILYWCLKEMVQRLRPKLFEVFITEGYDCDFTRKNITLDEMMLDIQQQVLTSFSIESCVYQIEV
ncbi:MULTISPECIES: hypothetical protein [unclassified Clostridium]|jgi:hypothetical protein|uniref:hypothetical protein n=1 Tax=unclassified Clostridium TaxID=2614128 RepID=UPI0011061A94|nr:MULTISPECIES: hypothetical protein [unclassified Clostridium]